jgi:DNA-binding transcriptional LysR family regulator
MQRTEQISRRLKLRQLNVLLAVAQWGSMAKAADHLAISQPVVSKAIAELEHVVGVRLLDRGPYGVEPTLYGRALLKRSIAIFDDLRTSVSELEFLSDPTAGELRIGCEENLATGLLPALIDRLARRHPRLVFEIVIADPKTLRERDLHGRNVEVAIMRTATPDLDADLEEKILYHDRLSVVAGMRSPWAGRRKIALADLINERWCLPPPDHPVGSLVIEAFRRSGLEPPRRSVTVGSAQCTSNLVAKGQFLGVHGSMFLRFTPPSVRLKVLPVELPIPVSSTSVVTLRDRTISPVAQLFIACAREVTKSLAEER